MPAGSAFVMSCARMRKPILLSTRSFSAATANTGSPVSHALALSSTFPRKVSLCSLTRSVDAGRYSRSKRSRPSRPSSGGSAGRHFKDRPTRLAKIRAAKKSAARTSAFTDRNAQGRTFRPAIALASCARHREKPHPRPAAADRLPFRVDATRGSGREMILHAGQGRFE